MTLVRLFLVTNGDESILCTASGAGYYPSRTRFTTALWLVGLLLIQLPLLVCSRYLTVGLCIQSPYAEMRFLESAIHDKSRLFQQVHRTAGLMSTCCRFGCPETRYKILSLGYKQRQLAGTVVEPGPRSFG